MAPKSQAIAPKGCKRKAASQSPDSAAEDRQVNVEGEESESKQKRVYSKGGCRECKRRKIKCDEGKPQCWQCMRLRKECSYPEAGEKVLRVSKKKQQQHEQMQAQRILHQIHGSPNLIDAVQGNGNQPIYFIRHDPNQPMMYQYPGPVYYQVPPPNSQQQPQHPQQQQQQQQQQQPQQPQPFIYAPNVPFAQQGQPQMAPIVKAQQLPQMNQQQLQQLQQAQQVQQVQPQQSQSQPQPQPQPQQQPIQQVSSAPALYSAAIQPQQPKPIVLPPPVQATKSNEEIPKATKTSSLMNLLNDSKRNGGKSAESIPPEEMMGLFDQKDLNLLSSDLNNMVNNIMYEMNYNYKDKYKLEENSTRSSESTTSVLKDKTLKNLPLDYIRLKKQKDQDYYEVFYNEFANIVLPFGSYDKENHNYCNPARDIILNCASSEDYVLAAVLANGARLRFSKTKNDEDEEAHCVYLSRCLKLLGPAISPDDNKLSSNIENVLLTVLLLTTANAANLKQDWRSHLKGAKDILLRHSKQSRKTSKILIFCKFWFIVLEILAGISCKKGGTLTSDEEVDGLINIGCEHEIIALKELGIILDNGFNIMAGYHHDCINYFKDLIKGLNRVRKGTLTPSFEYLKLFSQFQQQLEIEFINKKGINIGVTTGILVENPTDNLTISWQDVSHQSYVMAALITILTRLYQESSSSPQVQFLAKSIIEFESYLEDDKQEPPKFINRTAFMMLQWAMLTAGSNITDKKLQKIVTRFFEISELVGSGGASIALKKVTKLWRKANKGEDDKSEEESEEEDYVSY
ncbi:unnamed protein product [Candida verbasci]|uniref:Zn(2)-C6 fungal-type domain-containing protein n=1 Tax=Candida verbasci TaxID=1227364 RepID=A0A9W4TUH8_9ASCO|nr:unnamed protein product [Candida verbasci]